MTEEKTDTYNGGGLKGPIWALFGVATGALAKYALGGPGGIGGLFGAPMPPPPPAITREVIDLKVENATLKANAHADQMNAAQAVINAVQQGRIDCQQREIDRLYSLTQLVVPNRNVAPGWGESVVVTQAASAASTTTAG